MKIQLLRAVGRIIVVIQPENYMYVFKANFYSTEVNKSFHDKCFVIPNAKLI